MFAQGFFSIPEIPIKYWTQYQEADGNYNLHTTLRGLKDSPLMRGHRVMRGFHANSVFLTVLI